MTTVTVVIPVLNRARTITRAIDSAIGQRVPPDWRVDILIVDDGSTDALTEALRPYGDRVRLVAHARNLGAAAARNTGIAKANGDLIAFLDSDDVWLPGKLDAQIEFMRAARYTASCTAYILARPRTPDVVSPRYATGALAISDLVWGCFVSPGSTLICERGVLQEIGPFDVRLRRLEDWDLLLRFARTRALGFLASPLARIEASAHAEARSILRALSDLKERHTGFLSAPDRRHFHAATEFERAAAHYREQRYAPAVAALLNSLRLAPTGHVALKATLHNRLKWA
jgi:glycosyltransferase involved in cell wall biosynthesis